MLQAALHQILGKHIKQAGSFVDDKIFRFDLTHNKALTPQEIEQIEKIVNDKIQEDLELKIFWTTLQKAKEAGAMAFFGEKYNPEKVRVVQIPDFSTELCGGTHLKRTGQIGCFKILSDTALASGVRRITGVTGPQAVKLFQQDFNSIKNLSEKFKVKSENILSAVEKLEDNLRETEKQIKNLKAQIISSKIPVWINSIEEINGIPFLYLELEDLNNIELKQICLDIEKEKECLFFLTSGKDQINFVAWLSKSVEKKIAFKEFVKFLRDELQLKGGGSDNLLQGGGIKIKNLKTQIINWLKK
ncbi:MAG: DHHA1 domain-containing protein [bacterium]